MWGSFIKEAKGPEEGVEEEAPFVLRVGADVAGGHTVDELVDALILILVDMRRRKGIVSVRTLLRVQLR